MMKRLATLSIIFLLLPTVSPAQGRRGGGRGARGSTQMNEGTVILLLSALLSLSDMQQQQLRTAFDAAVKTAAPIATQLETNKDAIFDAVKSGKSDDQIKSLAAQQGSLTSQMLILQAQTFQKMWMILTSDQKAQVDPSMYDDIGEFLSGPREPVPTPVAEPPGCAAQINAYRFRTVEFQFFPYEPIIVDLVHSNRFEHATLILSIAVFCQGEAVWPLMLSPGIP